MDSRVKNTHIFDVFLEIIRKCKINDNNRENAPELLRSADIS